MIKSMLFIFSCILLGMQNQAQRLEKLWESEKVFKVPESVLYDAIENVLYVSNIDGASGAKDGKGHISKMSPDGKIIKLEWATGLHAPKGMSITGNMLYVADVDAIIGIEKETGKITERINIPGAKFLNDLTMDAAENLYVSDSETGIIHMVAHGESQPMISGRKRPNGVLWFEGRLYFADAGALYCRDFDGTIIDIAKGMEVSTDGIEPIDEDNFLMSSWIGALYLVNMNGAVTELLNTIDEKINSADIGYDPVNRILYVPTFSDNRVVAYKVIL